MKTVFIILMIAVSGMASATTYYVSSSSGNDANGGTSSLTAWQTIAKVNSQTFLPGDSILFRRGDIWNESLVAPSSGTAGNPVAFDAYGTGPAPNFTRPGWALPIRVSIIVSSRTSLSRTSR